MAERKPKTEPVQETKAPVQGSVLAAPAVVDVVARRNDDHDRLISLQNELYRESMGVLRDAMRFSDIDPSLQRDLDPAFERMENELGQQEAQRAYRVALLASMPSGDAPIGLKLAANVAVGIMKAKAAEKGGTHILNVQKVVLNSNALPQFEEREVESE